MIPFRVGVSESQRGSGSTRKAPPSKISTDAARANSVGMRQPVPAATLPPTVAS